jgi:RNA polymerase sigma-70 factor, ECF subfamily
VWSVLEEVTRSRGDISAIERSYRMHGQRLWRSVLLFSGSVDVADEAVAEAYAQALRRGDAIHDVDRWVWRASFKIARGELKRLRHRELADLEGATVMSSDTVDVVRALRSIPTRQRQAVILHHYADRSTREVARLMGTTPSAIAMLLDRARKNLRPLLEELDD